MPRPERSTSDPPWPCCFFWISILNGSLADVLVSSSIDRLIHATVGQATFGISPAALALAYAYWASHLAGPAALKDNAVKIEVGVCALDRPGRQASIWA